VDLKGPTSKGEKGYKKTGKNRRKIGEKRKGGKMGEDGKKE